MYQQTIATDPIAACDGVGASLPHVDIESAREIRWVRVGEIRYRDRSRGCSCHKMYNLSTRRCWVLVSAREEDHSWSEGGCIAGRLSIRLQGYPTTRMPCGSIQSKGERARIRSKRVATDANLELSTVSSCLFDATQQGAAKPSAAPKMASQADVERLNRMFGSMGGEPLP